MTPACVTFGTTVGQRGGYFVATCELIPRRFAAAGASPVRRLIASRSCCAVRASVPTVNALASGMLAATNDRRYLVASVGRRRCG